MNCREFRRGMEKLLAGELSAPDGGAFEAHAAKCERCENELNSLRGLDALVSTAFRHVDTPEGFVDRVVARLEETEERTVTEVLAAAELLPTSERAALPRGRTRWIWPVAAAVTLLSLSGALIHLTWGRRGPAPPRWIGQLGTGRHGGALVEIRRAGKWQTPSASGAAIAPGDQIRTRGGRPVELDLYDGATITARIALDANALLQVFSNHKVHLKRGAAYFRVSPRRADAPFWAHLGAGQTRGAIEVLGTAFEARVQGRGSLEVAVESGKVRLFAGDPSAMDVSKEVAAGQRGRVRGSKLDVGPADGPVALWHGDGGRRESARPELAATSTAKSAKEEDRAARAAVFQEETGPDAQWSLEPYEGPLTRLVEALRKRMGPDVAIRLELSRPEARARAESPITLRAHRMANVHILQWAARAAGLRVYARREDGTLAELIVGAVRERTPSEVLAAADRGALWRVLLEAHLERPLLSGAGEAALEESLGVLAKSAGVNIYLDRAGISPTRPVRLSGRTRALGAHLAEIASQVGGVVTRLDGAIFMTSPDRALLLARTARRYPVPELAQTGAARAAMAWIESLVRAAWAQQIGAFELEAGDGAIIAVASEAGHAELARIASGLRTLRDPDVGEPWVAQVRQALDKRPAGGFAMTERRPFAYFTQRLASATGLRVQVDPSAGELRRVAFRPRGMRWAQIVAWMARLTGTGVRYEPGKPGAVVFGLLASEGGAREVLCHPLGVAAHGAGDAVVGEVRRNLAVLSPTALGRPDMAVLGDRLAVAGGPVAQDAVSRVLDFLRGSPGPRTIAATPATPPPAWRLEIAASLNARHRWGMIECVSPADAFEKLQDLSATFVLSGEVRAMEGAVTLRFEDQSVRAVLDELCARLKLAYRIEHAAIFVQRQP